MTAPTADTPIETLRALLAQVAELPRPPIGAYRCLEDFVLREGRPSLPRPRPAGYRAGAPRECFRNAFWLAERRGLRYVEGYALQSFLPIVHAWCLDEHDEVVDPTWRWAPGTAYWDPAHGAYLGVEFPLDVVRLVLRVKQTWGILDDWERRWPMLQQPFDLDALRAHYRELARVS